MYVLKSEDVDFKSIAVLTAGRLVPLDKCPGLRPIGIGEILRRIIGKCVMMVLKKDVQKDAGPLQTCAGHEGGSKQQYTLWQRFMMMRTQKQFC